MREREQLPRQLDELAPDEVAPARAAERVVGIKRVLARDGHDAEIVADRELLKVRVQQPFGVVAEHAAQQVERPEGAVPALCGEDRLQRDAADEVF